MSNDQKVLENRYRRKAERRGYGLVKCARRDPHAIGYGRYLLVPFGSVGMVRGGGPDEIAAFDRGEGFTLDEIMDTMELPSGEMEEKLGLPRLWTVRS